jgi:hypothetical protein
MTYYRLIDDVLTPMVFARPVVIPPPPPDPDPWSGMIITFAASEGGTGSNVWEAAVALDQTLATGQGEAVPFYAGRHSYSGNSFPTTFMGSSAGANYDYGWTHSVLNVKTNWTSLANGSFDTHIANFIASIPVDHTVYLIIDHEPENDGRNGEAATWRNGQARAANLIASINDPRCYYAVCHMAYTWVPASGRNPDDWNPINPGGTITMTTAARQRAIFAPDGYTDVENSSGTSFQTMDERFTPLWTWATSRGFEKFAISEHALNNDIGAPAAAIANIWETDHFPYIEGAGSGVPLVYYAGYSSEGPAAGTNARIDTPEEIAAFGTWVKKHKYQIGI